MDTEPTAISDLQADLDGHADALDYIANVIFASNPAELRETERALEHLATELRNLLADRDLDVPPLTSEIIAWLEADPTHVVKGWSTRNAWIIMSLDITDYWRPSLAKHGDQRQHGYRLGVREPATERVRLDQIIGRTLSGETRPVRYFQWNDGAQRFEWCSVGGGWQPLSIAPDGTVEVLKDAP